MPNLHELLLLVHVQHDRMCMNGLEDPFFYAVVRWSDRDSFRHLYSDCLHVHAEALSCNRGRRLMLSFTKPQGQQPSVCLRGCER